MTKGNKITKLKVIIEFSIYNKDYKPPKMKAKLDEKTGLYISMDDANDIASDDFIHCYLSNDKNKDNPVYIEFNTGDVLEVKKIFVCHNLKSYAYIRFNNKTYEVPIEVLNFCTEKL